jgi:hypothetical protein
MGKKCLKCNKYKQQKGSTICYTCENGRKCHECGCYSHSIENNLCIGCRFKAATIENKDPYLGTKQKAVYEYPHENNGFGFNRFNGMDGFMEFKSNSLNCPHWTPRTSLNLPHLTPHLPYEGSPNRIN